MSRKMLVALGAVLFLLGPGLLGWAAEGYGYCGTKSCDGEHSGYGHHGETTGQYLHRILRDRKEIGLTPEQVTKLRAQLLDLTRKRIRAEAEIQVANLEAAALANDEKADLSAIEAKVKLSEDLEKELRMAAIKTKREAMAGLTPEQRTKGQAEHEKMMKEMRHSGNM
jgi:protein CpxP